MHLTKICALNLKWSSDLGTRGAVVVNESGKGTKNMIVPFFPLFLSCSLKLLSIPSDKISPQFLVLVICPFVGCSPCKI